MRMLILLALAMLAGSCSCQRDPDADATPPEPAAATAEPAQAAPAGSPEAADLEAARRSAALISNAVSGLHSYLGAAAAKDWTKADAFWAGGRPPPRPDDYALRAIEDLRSMRINNDRPVPLDQESPPRALEIPVTLRMRREDGTRELKGWYRLRRKIDSDDWEITSASLQPTLD
jgi:hypothetical protein